MDNSASMHNTDDLKWLLPYLSSYGKPAHPSCTPGTNVPAAFFQGLLDGNASDAGPEGRQ